MAQELTLSTPLQSLNNYVYETPQEKPVFLPTTTELVIVAFEKDTGALANEFFDTQSKTLLEAYDAVFIADIHNMPSIITSLFALPKLKKYKHPIYLHYDEEFENFIPHQEEKLTILRFKDAKVSSISYVSTAKELKAEILKW